MIRIEQMVGRTRRPRAVAGEAHRPLSLHHPNQNGFENQFLLRAWVRNLDRPPNSYPQVWIPLPTDLDFEGCCPFIDDQEKGTRERKWRWELEPGPPLA